MDITTLAMTLLLALTALGVDTVWHPPEVIVHASAAGKLDKIIVDEGMISSVVSREIDRISATPTLMGRPRVELGKQGGLGMAVATAAKVEGIAFALQKKAGYEPDEIKITLFGEDSALKVLVSGSGSQRLRNFEQVVELQKGETVVALLHRAALVGMSRIDPYLTTLNLMQRHESDQDFTDAETLITFAKAQLPPTPVNPERSLYENLQGILALFRGNKDDAHKWFEIAELSNPENVAAVLNHGFLDVQRGDYKEAAGRMQTLLRQPPTVNKVLIGTAYVTWGAALLGLHDVNGADTKLAQALEANPESPIAWELWAEVKNEKRDAGQAAKFHKRALETSGSFENYAELATLYFRLTWHNDQPVVRSRFISPASARSN